MSVGDTVEVKLPHKRRTVKGTITSLHERGFFYRDIDQKEHFALSSWLVLPKQRKRKSAKDTK